MRLLSIALLAIALLSFGSPIPVMGSTEPPPAPVMTHYTYLPFIAAGSADVIPVCINLQTDANTDCP